MIATKLVATDRPKELYRYVVSGKYPFPLDMLRYDSCWPAREANEIALSFDTRFRSFEPGKIYSVAMLSYSPPTIARWHSFGYVVN